MNNEPVTRSECTENQRCLRVEIRDAIRAEKDDREKELNEIRGWLVRIEGRIDGMNSKLTAVIIELLVGIILVVLVFILGGVF